MRNLEAKKEYQKKYYQLNKAKLLAYRKNHYSENKEVYHQRLKEWAKANPDARKSALLKNVYGISLNDYKQLFEQQKGLCKGCGASHSELKRGLMVDHDHQTKKVRGLLCDACNRALGAVKDNVDTLKNLLDYLQNNGQ